MLAAVILMHVLWMLIKTLSVVYLLVLLVTILFIFGMLVLACYVCTYRAYDAMDEITAAFSISFNPAGTRIFAGYNKSRRVFDIHRPGRDFEQHSTVQGNKEGQTGIISSIAFCPTHSGMLVTGSYSQTTAVFREDNMELLYVLHGQEGPILKKWKLSLFWGTEGWFDSYLRSAKWAMAIWLSGCSRYS